MNQKKRSPLVVIGLGVVIMILVITLLNQTVRLTKVVVAKEALAPGTILSESLVEERTIPAGGAPRDGYKTVDEVTGKMLSVGRAPGDFITSAVLGEEAMSGIPAQLEPGHVALAVKVRLDSGVAGLLRPGQRVTIIGMLSPEGVMSSYSSSNSSMYQNLMGQNGTPVPTLTPTPMIPSAPLARISITGIQVLMVPQSFRYEEIPASGSDEQMFSAARTTSNAQSGSVIVLDVPTQPIELQPGYLVNPAVLIASLNEYGVLYLVLEPADGLGIESDEILTLNLGTLYNVMSGKQAQSPVAPIVPATVEPTIEPTPTPEATLTVQP